MHRGSLAEFGILLLNIYDLFKDDLMKLRRIGSTLKLTVLRLYNLRLSIEYGHVFFDLIYGSIATLL
jgi:hypothetical protein